MAEPTSMAFRSLLARMKPGMSKKVQAAFDDVKEEKEVAEPSPDEKIAVELMQWARARAYRDVFLPEVLEAAIRFAKIQRYTNTVSHSLSSFWSGYEKAIEDLKERFEGWQTGQVAEGQATPKE